MAVESLPVAVPFSLVDDIQDVRQWQMIIGTFVVSEDSIVKGRGRTHYLAYSP